MRRWPARRWYHGPVAAGAEGRRGGEPERVLFAVAIFASAFLVFLVQPMVGKRILPWFGGAPSVWSLCLAFYQTTLFCGYAYAHLLIRYATPLAQLAVHAGLVLAALAVLPVLPGEVWRPAGVERPAADILEMLVATVALPFLVLAATGPLVQAWFAIRQPDRSPYPLYAVSNAGSLIALVAYPFVLEPRFALTPTGDAWSLGFALTAAAVVGCAALAWRATRGRAAPDRSAAPGPRSPEPVGPLRAASWLLFAGCAVVVLMGVTNRVCLDVASVPFLWVLPLGAYLLSFIVCFSSDRAYRRAPYVALAVAAWVLTEGRSLWREAAGVEQGAFVLSFAVQVPAYCVLLFSTCMVLHGELYRMRPAPSKLTAYYLFVSAGGALGGLFVGLLAPLVFDDYLELPLGLATALVLLLAACANDPSSTLHRGAPRWRWAVVAPVTAGVLLYAGVTAARSKPERIHQERSFFGVVRVDELREGEAAERVLISGSTVHGVQLIGEGAGRAPTSYYGHATAIGMLLAPRAHERPLRVGVIGLGVGTLAAYGRPGEVFRFYEIDPAIVDIARDSGHFSFLDESPATVDVVVGDGRLLLADEQSRGVEQSFDWLVLDAFSSDAIPVHLLTREAFAVYRRARAPDGVLAAHVSNRHFDLMPQVARQGFETGLHSLLVGSSALGAYRSQQSVWILMAPGAEHVDRLVDQLRRRLVAMGLPRRHLELIENLPDEVADVPLWTDDYSDLLGTLRAK